MKAENIDNVERYINEIRIIQDFIKEIPVPDGKYKAILFGLPDSYKELKVPFRDSVIIRNLIDKITISVHAECNQALDILFENLNAL